MKKIFFALGFSFSLISSALAAPCYGPKMPEAKQFFGGLQVYRVFKRHLEDDFGYVKSIQNFLLLSYGVFDWLSLDLKGGIGDIELKPDHADEVDYKTFLGGGYGFRLKLYNGEKSKVIFGFQHISIHPRRVTVNGERHKSVLDDWQFSLLGSYQIADWEPYLGVKWSRMDNIHWIDGNRRLEQSDLARSAGLVLGLNVPVKKSVWLNVEGQLIDVCAISGSINFAF